MDKISLERTNLAQKLTVSLLTFAALLLLGAVLAYWTWGWFAPRPVARAPAAAESGGRVAAANQLFGTLQREQGVAAPTGIAIKLLGVMAGSAGRSGYAVVQLDAKNSLAVREGKDVAPGIKLAEVYPDHVILERNGTRETLAWPRKGTPAESPAPRINN